MVSHAGVVGLIGIGELCWGGGLLVSHAGVMALVSHAGAMGFGESCWGDGFGESCWGDGLW